MKRPPVDPIKRKILDLAFYAFNEQGYKAVSMDLVARELRISKKTIYRHFQSKEEILETGMAELFSEYEQKFTAVLEQKDARAVIIGFFDLYRSLMDRFTTPLREEIVDRLPHLEPRIRSFERQVLQQNLLRWMKSQRKLGVLDYPSPTREIVGTLLHLMLGIINVPEEKAHFMLDALLKGMAGSGSRKKKK